MIQDNMLDGQKVEEVLFFPDSRGYLLDLLSPKYNVFDGFGHLYCTVVNKDVVKGWHVHNAQSEVVMCVAGQVRMVCYDMRDDSPTKGAVWEDIVGEEHFVRVLIPKGVAHAWQGLSYKPACVIVVANQPYNRCSPDIVAIDVGDPGIPYEFRSPHEC